MDRLCFWILLAALLALSGCGGNKPRRLQPDPKFSINVMAVPSDWPDEKRDWPKDEALATVQQQVFEENGSPDFFRFRWRKDEKPMTRRELQQMMYEADRERSTRRYFKSRTIEIDWIYLSKGVLYKFGKSGAEEKPIEDQWRVICDYGDPQDIKQSVDFSGRPNVIYQYFSEGKIFYFRDGVKYREEDQPRMEGFRTFR